MNPNALMGWPGLPTGLPFLDFPYIVDMCGGPYSVEEGPGYLTGFREGQVSLPSCNAESLSPVAV